ncbi:SMP-30/gluconolactonase/LRE family protein [Jiangella alkaliphila]|uniref:Sugar lactone lactonase YvrE n=1 Tax=Jiangella alkaliphila TaxID=419479 RepID=A0A1H2K4Z2_9ACTN|nr:SMP-30/gluconolactonase/LRE family protein [Jiangella alkaliphila]SDU63521.1 Sugar lactone lactonase YvrE [Jiangella alkaliphila]
MIGHHAQHAIRCQAEVGEGPLYDAHAETLYWVDIPAGHLWRWSRAERSMVYQAIGEPLGSVALIEGGGLLLATRRGILVQPTWSDLPRLWSAVETDLATQFNDGKCDSRGRFVAGTAAVDPRFTGSLYRVDHDGSTHRLFGDIGMSNGLDWSPDDAYFYHVDTLSQTVRRYEWDADEGVPHHPVPFIEIPPGDGLPDGLCVDSEGCLWLAVWGGGEVRRYAPDGRPLGAISVPTPNVTSCTFGGPRGTTLFITTAALAAPGHGGAGRFAGDVFVATTPVTGQRRPPFPRAGIPAELLEPRAPEF